MKIEAAARDEVKSLSLTNLELSEFTLREDGGINTNEEVIVKQYFSYYAKLVNQ